MIRYILKVRKLFALKLNCIWYKQTGKIVKSGRIVYTNIPRVVDDDDNNNNNYKTI